MSADSISTDMLWSNDDMPATLISPFESMDIVELGEILTSVGEYLLKANVIAPPSVPPNVLIDVAMPEAKYALRNKTGVAPTANFS